MLTTKVAKLILEDEVRFPQKIACITFSRQLAEKLVKELRDLGVYNAERIYVGTIHAFCVAEILMPGAHLLPSGTLPDPFRIAAEEERLDALAKSLEEQKKTLPEKDSRNIQRDLEKFRRRYFQPGTKSFSQTNLSESSDSSKKYLGRVNWAKLANDYHHCLRQEFSSIDFVQIEMMSLHLLRTQRALAMTLTARYPWWFVDEYQDLSPLFHQMVTGLVKPGDIKIFAIGDPNQCIYEDAQGSKPESIHELAQTVEQCSGVSEVILQKNYRSAQNLIDFSDHVLGQPNSYRSNVEQQAQIHVIYIIGLLTK